MASSESSAWDRYRNLASGIGRDPSMYQYRSRPAGHEVPQDDGHLSRSISGSGFQVIEHRSNLEMNFYLLFGVHREASSEEIERGYRSYVKRIHPDKCYLDPERHWKAEKSLKLANIAIGVLRDPEQRARYDAAYTSWRERWKGSANTTRRHRGQR